MTSRPPHEAGSGLKLPFLDRLDHAAQVDLPTRRGAD